MPITYKALENWTEDGATAIVVSAHPTQMEIIALFYDKDRADAYLNLLQHGSKLPPFLQPTTKIEPHVEEGPHFVEEGSRNQVVIPLNRHNLSDLQLRVLNVLKNHMDEGRLVKLSQGRIAEEASTPKETVSPGSAFYALRKLVDAGAIRVAVPGNTRTRTATVFQIPEEIAKAVA